MSDGTGRMSLAQREHEVLSFWREQRIFERSVQERLSSPTFNFYDGPPFATGLPHYGHMLASSIKDVVGRFMTLKGFHVPRRFGWDCHGLPVEAIVEKKEGLSGGASIREYGIARFNETCRENVLTYTEQWRATIDRLGRWVDMDNGYKTMDPSYMESVWWVFKKLYDQGLVYSGYKVMPFSWKLGTPLSNFEAGENYQNVDDPSLTLAFQDLERSDLYYLAWTTTPWTLVSNMGLIVGPDIIYAEVTCEHKSFILAEERLQEVFKDKPYSLVRTYLGHELVNRRYHPLMDDFASMADQGAFRLVSGQFVSTADGTGIVHAAPAFGENDFEVAKESGLPMVCPINENGLFTQAVARYSGKLWRDCQKEIIRELKEGGKIFQQATLNHRYPFCYRTDTPLIYRATQTWFIAVEKIKQRLIHHNRSIRWVPEHIRDGRFGKWLENARDWAISRNRFWGTPIPLWQSEDGDLIAISSVSELQELTGVRVTDLHRHIIDPLVIKKNGKEYRRIDAVFDCWFESGSMPYAQNHYPFENKEVTERSLPADFIAEGMDQTRGWFYTLHVLSCALFDRPAFSHVIVNGIVLAKDGNKMSKRLQNYPDPMHVLERYGADALRLYLLKSPVVRAEDLAFNESGIDMVLKQMLLPLWNSYHFFSTYATIYKWDSELHSLDDLPLTQLDQWVLSRLQTLITTVDRAMSHYHLWESIEAIAQFIEEITNWYIRRSRRRFWSEDQIVDRNCAMQTLYQVLITLCQIASPFAPFLTERIYQLLRASSSPSSVHLCNWPAASSERTLPQLERVMEAVQRLSSMGHGLRKENKLRVRQPLAQAWIVVALPDSATLAPLLMQYSNLLAEELNVKAIGLKLHTSDLLRISYKANFKTLGSRAGKKMRSIQSYIPTLTDEQYRQLGANNSLTVEIDSEPFELLPQDVILEHHVLPGQIAAYENGLAIALETELTPELILEGLSRELVNKVNSLRKEKEFDISDRIQLQLGLDPIDPLRAMLDQHGRYICEETLSTGLDLQTQLKEVDSVCELGDYQVQITITRVALRG